MMMFCCGFFLGINIGLGILIGFLLGIKGTERAVKNRPDKKKD